MTTNTHNPATHRRALRRSDNCTTPAKNAQARNDHRITAELNVPGSYPCAIKPHGPYVKTNSSPNWTRCIRAQLRTMHHELSSSLGGNDGCQGTHTLKLNKKMSSRIAL